MAIKNNIPARPAKQPKELLGWLLIIMVIFCQLLAYTWVRTESTQTILRITQARETHSRKISYNKALLVEKERLMSDERITRIAKTRLSLLEDTAGQTIYFSGEDS
ncbi:MAG: hypothetical protein KKE62_02995 [Proteobacteria bacterium]|nr:hypothetical protein [Pseudomonadota bacterium]MBU1388634.1 hypothetical protein [Pseudomonadota bacterium]MBU1541790.1 hypothetical protein [Pseudomonadota bacterium]MBU2480077.1 hypothetical protein [Pseudomonadota bacterium]